MNQDNASTGPRHPIAVAADRTQLSQDVLRVWERRYRAVQPSRGPGGQRLYSDADIARLRLLHSATQAGRSIGQVAGLSNEVLLRLAEEDASARGVNIGGGEGSGALESDLVGPALALTRALDAAGLEWELRRLATMLGASVFVDAVVTPLLGIIGEEWHAGRLSPAQEHLASATLHGVISEVVRSVGAGAVGPRILVATPAGERHAIGAVLAAVTAAVLGWRVTSLGSDLPAKEIARAAVATQALAVGVSVIYLEDKAATLSELTEIRVRLPADVPLLAGGTGSLVLAEELALAGVRVLADLSDLRSVLQGLTPVPAS